MNIESLTCKICYEFYDEANRIPESLVPCGHTLCKDCLNKLRKRECPTCKKWICQTVVNWDLIPNQDLAHVAVRQNCLVANTTKSLDELTDNFENSLLFVNKEDIETTKYILEDMKKDINLRAQNLIRRIIDEQSNLINVVDMSHSSLDERQRQNVAFERCQKLKLAQLRVQLSQLKKKLRTGRDACYMNELRRLNDEIKMEHDKLEAIKRDSQKAIRECLVKFHPKSYEANYKLLGRIRSNSETEEHDYYAASNCSSRSSIMSTSSGIDSADDDAFMEKSSLDSSPAIIQTKPVVITDSMTTRPNAKSLKNSSTSDVKRFEKVKQSGLDTFYNDLSSFMLSFGLKN